MARKRIIDPNIWQSEDFGKLSTLAKLVFIGLFSNADDEGRGRANPTYLKSVLFPYEERIKSTDINTTLSEISSNMSIVFYSCGGNSYYSLTNWDNWQKIEKPQGSKLPAFDESNENIRRLFDDQSTTNRRPFDDRSTTSRRLIDDRSTTVRRPVVPNRIEKNKKRIEQEDNNIFGQNEVKTEPTFVGHVTVLEAWETQFEEFYRAYPKKVKKQDVKKWFKKNKPSNELFSSMMNSLEQFRASKDWQKDGGQYIPYPSTWLNQARWEDENIDHSGMNDFAQLWREAKNEEN